VVRSWHSHAAPSKRLLAGAGIVGGEAAMNDSCCKAYDPSSWDLARRCQDPTRLLLLFVTTHIIVWTIAPAVSHNAPTFDLIENYMFGKEWVLATYKHPALTNWILESSRHLTGAVIWPAYLISQLFVGATFCFAFLLGRALIGPIRGAAGTLLLAGVTFYAWPTLAFNHDVASMPFWTAIPWALWRAVQQRRSLWWVGLGLLSAAGLYAKLQTGLLLGAAAAWILYDGRARGALLTAGPWLGAAVFLVTVSPLINWLTASDFSQFRYVAMRSETFHGRGIIGFLLYGLGNVVTLMLMLVWADLIGLRRASKPNLNGRETSPIDRRALSYLVVMFATPVALTIVGAGITGMSLRPAWAKSMFGLTGLLAVALTAYRFGAQTTARIAVAAGLAVMFFPTVYALYVKFQPLWGTVGPMNWPQDEIARRMTSIWMHETQKPLRIVSGDPRVAGLVGLTAPDMPSIYYDFVSTPWITPERIDKEGMLLVWNINRKILIRGAQGLAASSVERAERFRVPYASRTKDIMIGYIIIPPRS